MEADRVADQDESVTTKTAPEEQDGDGAGVQKAEYTGPVNEAIATERPDILDFESPEDGGSKNEDSGADSAWGTPIVTERPNILDFESPEDADNALSLPAQEQDGKHSAAGVQKAEVITGPEKDEAIATENDPDILADEYAAYWAQLKKKMQRKVRELFITENELDSSESTRTCSCWRQRESNAPVDVTEFQTLKSAGKLDFNAPVQGDEYVSTMEKLEQIITQEIQKQSDSKNKALTKKYANLEEREERVEKQLKKQLRKQKILKSRGKLKKVLR